MELRALKYGDLMGSPDTKARLLAAGPGSAAAHEAWERMAALKLAHGWTGRCTTVLLLEPDLPEAFPAAVDLSYISPDPASHGEASVAASLDAVRAAGVPPEEIRSLLVTHPHPDHFDPRLLEHLPEAVVFGPDGAALAGARPFDPDRFGGLVEMVDTPGHGGPHASFVLDLPRLGVAMAIAGDLIMSHAHYLAADHPLSFADHDAARQSIAALLEALGRRPPPMKVIFPGHDRPFFAHDRRLNPLF